MPAREISLRKRGYPQLVRAHVRGAGITPEVQAEVGHYFDRRPDIRACEAAEHGYDPASDVPRYLAQELAEPGHATIRSADGLTLDAIRDWERQEDAEHAGDGRVAKAQATHAGIVVRAADSGRILMLQRSIADASDPARGTWEFPGGEIEQGETPKQGAVREWQEETGTTLPPGAFVGQWSSGIYEGFVYLVDHEADVPLNVDADDRLICNPDDPDGDDAETLAWWAPSDARKNPALRDAVKGSDWRVIDQAVPDAVFKGFPTLVFRKDEPTATDVHVDVPLGSAKKKRKKGEPADPELSILKADDEQRIVYGIVLEPDVEDSQGDIVSKGDVELAAHRYLYQQGLAIGDQHGKLSPPDVRPVESYIAPCDFEMGGQTVKKGSWVLVAKVADDDLWQQVKKGHKGAWSVGGTGKRSPLIEKAAEDDPSIEEALGRRILAFLGGSTNAAAPVVHVHVPEQPAPVVNVHHAEPEVHVHVPEQTAPVVHNHVAAPETPELHAHVTVEHPRPSAVRVETGEDGSTRYIPED